MIDKSDVANLISLAALALAWASLEDSKKRRRIDEERRAEEVAASRRAWVDATVRGREGYISINVTNCGPAHATDVHIGFPGDRIPFLRNESPFPVPLIRAGETRALDMLPGATDWSTPGDITLAWTDGEGRHERTVHLD